VQINDKSSSRKPIHFGQKTKCMLFTTSRMSTYHSLSSRPLQLAVEEKALQRVKSTKLLGVHLKENLKWNVHVKHLASTCYGTLANLTKIKNFTTFTLRKHLAESLIISRLDFSNIVFLPLTEHLLNRLQRIQYSTASFVTGRYVNSIESILKRSCSFKILMALHYSINSKNVDFWKLGLSFQTVHS
jgi:hypothetical protein